MSLNNNFYLYLPSSVKNTVIENKLNHYITELNTPLRLDPNERYELALLYITYPKSVMNVSDGYFEYYSPTLGEIVPSRIPSGVYDTVEKIFDALKTVMYGDAEYYKFYSDPTTHLIRVFCQPFPFGQTARPYLHFSENLQILTGFKDMVDDFQSTIGDFAYDLHGWNSNFYIYTNIIQHVSVGSITSPLLAVVSYKPTGDFSEQVQHEILNPIYVPLKDTVIKTIEVEILNKKSVGIPFSSGEVVCLFHIRKID